MTHVDSATWSSPSTSTPAAVSSESALTASTTSSGWVPERAGSDRGSGMMAVGTTSSDMGQLLADEDGDMDNGRVPAMVIASVEYPSWAPHLGAVPRCTAHPRTVGLTARIAKVGLRGRSRARRLGPWPTALDGAYDFACSTAHDPRRGVGLDDPPDDTSVLPRL